VTDVSSQESVQDQIVSVRQLQEVVAREREELALIAKKSHSDNLHSQGSRGADSTNEMQKLQETIATLESEIAEAQGSIVVLERHWKSAEQQHEYTRKQLNAIEQQGIVLSNQEDDFSLALLKMEKKDRAKQEEKLTEIRRLVEANTATRKTLLAEKEAVDKERKHMTDLRRAKNEHKTKVEKKLALVRELHKTVLEATSEYNADVKFLKERSDEMRQHFLASSEQKEFTRVMQDAERDIAFLDKIEAQVQNLRSSREFDQARLARTNLIYNLLIDIISLRRAWVAMQMQKDQVQREDFDLSSFLPKKCDEKDSKLQAAAGPSPFAFFNP